MNHQTTAGQSRLIEHHHPFPPIHTCLHTPRHLQTSPSTAQPTPALQHHQHSLLPLHHIPLTAQNSTNWNPYRRSSQRRQRPPPSSSSEDPCIIYTHIPPLKKTRPGQPPARNDHQFTQQTTALSLATATSNRNPHSGLHSHRQSFHHSHIGRHHRQHPIQRTLHVTDITTIVSFALDTCISGPATTPTNRSVEL